MKTLVYFAAGTKIYSNLPYDRIILVDKLYRKKVDEIRPNIIRLGMDCLESVDFMKKMSIKIDCMVALCEGLYEGGGRYSINSDTFVGYAMQILKDEYIHIMNNKNYYNWYFRVSYDFPYEMCELSEKDEGYLSPYIFTRETIAKDAHVFRMKKITKEKKFKVSDNLSLRFINDSIWNYYQQLDLLGINVATRWSENFFHSKPKVYPIKEIGYEGLYNLAVKNMATKIGFTPYQTNKIDETVKLFSDLDKNSELCFFHLNKSDYQNSIKILYQKGLIESEV